MENVKDEKSTAEAKVKDKVFEANAKLDVYWKTSDGTAFFTENAARNHARSLKDKTVKKVTR